MGKPISKNGSWRLSWKTYEAMPDLPFLMGVGVHGNPITLAFTLSANRINREGYLYKNPDKIVVKEGGWIVHISGWLYLD